MEAIYYFSRRNKLHIVEDLAEAHGIPPHRGTAAACWSFYKNKIIHGEEGGMVAFRNKEIANRARQLRSLGFTDAHDFLHIPRGMSYRLANSQAEQILQSLREVNTNLEGRRRTERYYDELVPDYWQLPPRGAPWVYDLRIPGIDLDWTIHQLAQRGIAARHSFKPMSSQPEYAKPWKHLRAYSYSREVFYLPLSPETTRLDVEGTVKTLQKIIASRESGRHRASIVS